VNDHANFRLTVWGTGKEILHLMRRQEETPTLWAEAAYPNIWIHPGIPPAAMTWLPDSGVFLSKFTEQRKPPTLNFKTVEFSDSGSTFPNSSRQKVSSSSPPLSYLRHDSVEELWMDIKWVHPKPRVIVHDFESLFEGFDMPPLLNVVC
jgi:hypothetical protein